MPTVEGPVSGKTLTAPLSGVECVWFKVRVESWQVHKDLHHRDTVYLHRSVAPVLVGGTPVSSRLLTGVMELAETVTGKRPPTPAEAPLLHALKNRGVIEESAFKRRAHLLDEIAWETVEYVLRPGELVTARGRLSRGGLLKPSLFVR